MAKDLDVEQELSVLAEIATKIKAIDELEAILEELKAKGYLAFWQRLNEDE